MPEFGPDTPVLWFDAGTPRHAGAKRSLLWPARAYTVIAPRVVASAGDRLDVFQDAILRLLCAEMRDEREIARALRLDRRLVAYIVAGLRERRLCDDRRVPTEQGLRALDQEQLDEDDLCLGHVFQDPTTHSMWGRFVERLPQVEADWKGSRAILQLGTAGRPWTPSALAVPPDALSAPSTPTATAILREVRRHRRALENGDDSWSGGGEAPPAPENLRRMSAIGEDPLPVWLGVTIYATDIDDDGAGWNVSDPFGLGPSPRLRGEIERAATTHEPLRKLIRALVGQDTDNRAVEVEVVRMDLEEQLGLDLRRLPDVHGLLVDMRVAVERAAQDRRPVAARADATVRVQRALERVLSMTLGESAEQAALDLVDDLDQDGELLDARARQLGLEPLPRALRRVSAARVRAAIRHESGSLRPLLVANLLAAASDPAHSLHALAGERPGVLTELDAIADARNRSAHDRGEPPRQDQLEQFADTALDVTRSMLLEGGALRGQREVQHG